MTSRSASSHGTVVAAKPKVLLVDDHPDLLKSLSRILSHDFDIVDVATEGRQALDAARRVEPDLVVLDITMPGLDGFQTARELTRIRSRARIVFLTMHEQDEFVTEGFRSGGRGYVLKRRVHDDLVRAMRGVLAGQMYAPSLTSLLKIGDGWGHAARFYPDDDAFIDELSAFLVRALRRGDTVSVVMRDHIRAGLATRLRSQGWNVGESGEHGRYNAVDSLDALSAIVRDGTLDADRLAEMVGGLERTRVTRGVGSSPRHTIVGEITVPLFANGNADVGMKVERIWNDLTRTLPFLTVCCYPSASFDAHAEEVLTHVCAEHWAVV